MSDTCPLCGSSSTETLLTLANVPVTCASVFDSREEARAVPKAVVDLTTCQRCAFIFNRAFNPGLGNLAAQYESSQAASGHFGAYAKALAMEWVSKYALTGRTVIEVGCGDGSFMKQLLASGVERAIGVDPLAHEPKGPRPDAINLIPSFFDSSHTEIPAAALVCRHTLEHVHDPQAFLALLRRWAEQDADRILLVEIPDADRILRERAFWDIYYEHCSYFTETTVVEAFCAAGLEVINVRRVYGEQYLIVEARARVMAAATTVTPSKRDILNACRSFATDVRANIMRCTNSMDQLMLAQRPLLLWQGAAKAVGFISALPDRIVIDGAVDVSPRRCGKFLPGSGLPVIAPEALPEIRPTFVVLMNPVYLDEVRRKVRDLGSSALVVSVNDLLAANFVPPTPLASFEVG